MVYLKLFYNFILVGILSFGGGHTAIPLVQSICKNIISISNEEMINYIAISESTPGPVAINLATFVGMKSGGILGAIIASIAIIIPAFVIIILFIKFFDKYLKNNNINFILSFVRVGILAMITAVGIDLLLKSLNIYDLKNDFLININLFLANNNNKIIIISILLVIMFISKKVFKKKISTISLILCGAMLGVIFR